MGFEFEIDEIRHMSRTMQGDRRDPYGVEAFAYYASFGLLDPKAPFVDAPAAAATFGVSYYAGLGIAVGSGMVLAGIIGWTLDPHHKHQFGYDEFYKSSDGDYYGYTSVGSYQEQPSDMNW